QILCLDGGGIRGIISTRILMHIEAITRSTIFNLFDTIAGTSTGGILTIGIAKGMSLLQIMEMYFKFKEMMFHGARPYDTEKLEKYLKQEFGENVRLGDLVGPKIMLMSVLADRMPAELHIFKNYEIPGAGHVAYHSTDKRFPPLPKPKDEYVWKALRATTAATSYFKAYGRFIDGAYIANNPTLDVLTEMFKLMKAHENNEDCTVKPIHIVVSVGTGKLPVKKVEVCDIQMPRSIWELPNFFSNFMNVSELLIDQTFQPEGHIVHRAAAWCGMIGAPFFRLNPTISQMVELDCKDDLILVNILWETECYIEKNKAVLDQLCRLLVESRQI
ncbi:hypothetical protein HELRODRAFT_92371, partial [Helobdella robusta]|uniref:PNPLA domain-containing protein n=1 Tax=Helobdella robusta TaxID=6412 RepID=T1G8F2_HELRO